MNTNAPSFINPADAQASGDKLDAVRNKAREARDVELLIEQLEEQIKSAKTARDNLIYKELPDLLDAANIDKIGLPEEAGLPAYDINLKPFYRANIAASWPHDKRQAAFNWLTEHGHGDLIKTEITVGFARGAHNEALSFAQDTKERGLEPEMKEAVHTGTLSAWLRETVEKGQELPPLEVLGASVGRVATLKERK